MNIAKNKEAGIDNADGFEITDSSEYTPAERKKGFGSLYY